MKRIPGSEDPLFSPHAAGMPVDSHAPDLDHAFWRQFIEATDLKAFCQSWLPLQCRMLQGVRCGIVLLGPPDHGPFSPIAVWPNPKLSMHHLTGAAERALKERRGLLIKNESPDNPESYHVAYPIEVSGAVHGVVILGVDPDPGHKVQAILRQLHWGAGWLEALIRRADAVKSAQINERLQVVLNVAAGAVEHERFQSAAMAFVTAVAMNLDCDRVSVGFVERKHVRVRALSHSAEFGKQMNLVNTIASAMEEAIDQKAAIVYPLPSDDVPLVVRAHAELARQHGAGTICTIPLGGNEKFFGGLTLERPADKVFDQATVDLAETMAALVGPILDAKRTEERWLITKASEALVAQLKKLVGPGHLILKASCTVLLGLIIFFAFAKGDYRVTGPTALEGVVQRTVCAPFNGYVKEASARAGDRVDKEEVLCLLDDRDLKLERLNWSSQREQLLKEHRAAMANYDWAKIKIVNAKIEQAEAQLALIDEQLARTKIVAPFPGVVMSGDLSQSLGAPVERGEVLFEVAPLDAYRVIAQVDEHDIAEVAVGQRGDLVLPSMPGDVFPFIIDQITPVSTAKEGRNYFRVEARLEESSERLRPGMEGIGKIRIDRRKLIWIWTHDLIDWLRLQFWRWIP